MSLTVIVVSIYNFEDILINTLIPFRIRHVLTENYYNTDHSQNILEIAINKL